MSIQHTIAQKRRNNKNVQKTTGNKLSEPSE